jgi:hypothetical protein
MKLLFLTIIGFLLFISVFGQNKLQDKKALQKREYSVIDDSTRHKLERLLSISQINQIQDFLTAFHNIKNAHDLHNSFSQIYKMSGSLEDTLAARQEGNNDLVNNIDWLDIMIPGINFSQYEGTSVYVKPRLMDFKLKAESTKEKSDNDFIDIIIMAYGEYYLIPEWINQTWDYGGPSLLGDETELKILIKIQTALLLSKEFENELNNVKKDIFKDILSWPCYNYTSKKIIEELNKILNSVKLTEKETQLLKNRIEVFKFPPRGFFIDCEHKECDCGG